jgi:hypothetical protein
MSHRAVSARLLFLLLLSAGVYVHAADAGKKALEEADLAKLIELQIDEATIVSKINGSGIAFQVDDAALARLKKAGASEAVAAAVRKAAAKPSKTSTTPGSAITYEDISKLLQLGIKEDAILERLKKSPTVFVFDAAQLKELHELGASESLIAALKGQRKAETATAEITDLAYILDCSNSMNEKTTEGATKMETARKVVADLIRKTPEGLYVTFIVYGHDRQQGCKAVKIARELSELDASGKEALASMIGGLKAVGSTPIALALETAGKELAKNNSYCGIVLITDGMESCHGKPAEVAALLAQNPKLSFGINVIGFDVKPEERAGVEEIAKAGHGTYYHADSAAKFAEVVQTLRKALETKVAAAPAQREKVAFKAAGKNAPAGAFLNDAPLVEPAEYKGTLEMMGAHYYQVAVRKGQELRAVGIVQKTPYEAANNRINQTFSVTIYDQNFAVGAREKVVVAGNPTTPNTVRAIWTCPADGVAHVGIAASDNHDGSGVFNELYKDLNPKPSPYTLRIRLEGDATGDAPQPLARLETKPGSGFDSAGELKLAGQAAADLKLGEVFFYRLSVQKGDKLMASAAMQKPWYRASNSRIQARYTLTAYDDDQVQVAQEKIQVDLNPPDARSLSITWPVTLSGNAYISVACENSGLDVYPRTFEPKPGRLAVQVVPQPAVSAGDASDK